MSSAVPAYPAGSIPAVPSGLAPTALHTGGHVTVPDEEIRVYGHSNLFYWWPVWAVAFLMATLTLIDGHVMAIVPSGTTVEPQQVLPGDDRPRDVLVAPPGQPVPPARAESTDPNPHLRVASNNNYGVVFAGTLLFVVLVTNMILRGLASVIAVSLLIILGLVVALLGWWDDIFHWIGGVDVRMNAGGYLAIGIPLLLMWLFSTFVYDRYTYLIVTRGQVRICQQIGDGELAVDASGLMLEKKRNDLFRHWLLGMGSGDLHVKTSGPANLDFQLNNVLFVGSKIARIQNMLREKEVAEEAVGA
jgi:hypothetical protein